ncbi:unnamed protein product [Merluccius merluccius]
MATLNARGVGRFLCAPLAAAALASPLAAIPVSLRVVLQSMRRTTRHCVLYSWDLLSMRSSDWLSALQTRDAGEFKGEASLQLCSRTADATR